MSGLIVVVATLSGFFAMDHPKSTDAVFQRLKDDDFSGVVLMAKGNRVLRQESYGYASCDESVPNTTETVQAIGSITKMFTQAAIAQLADARKLDLNGSIGDYMDDVPADKSAITIRQLLHHTSGLSTYHETTNEGDFQPMTKQVAFENIIKKRSRSAPGKRENYSNNGYTLCSPSWWNMPPASPTLTMFVSTC